MDLINLRYRANGSCYDPSVMDKISSIVNTPRVNEYVSSFLHFRPRLQSSSPPRFHRLQQGHTHMIDSYNCTIDRQRQLEHFGHPAVFSFSILCVLFNSLVIHLLRLSRSRRPTHAQLHLQALACSDVSVGLTSFCIGIVSWHCDLCQPCQRAWTCALVTEIFYLLWAIFGCVNRVMTVCITFFRAEAVSSLRNALRGRAFLLPSSKD